MVVPAEGDPRAGLALSALIHALAEMQRVAIVRYFKFDHVSQPRSHTFLIAVVADASGMSSGLTRSRIWP